MPPTTLTYPPIEILDRMFSCLDNKTVPIYKVVYAAPTWPSLYAPAITCRALTAISCRVLWRTITFEADVYRNQTGMPQSHPQIPTTAVSFLRCIFRNANNLDLIKTAEIAWHEEMDGKGHHNILTALFTALSRSSSLIELVVFIGDAQQNCETPSLTHYSPGVFPNLKMLKLITRVDLPGLQTMPVSVIVDWFTLS